MPNWCTTNYFLTGKDDELKRLAATINRLPKEKPAAPNDFGPYWLGNIYVLLGKSWEGTECRGWLDPDPWADACMWPQMPEHKRVVAHHGQLRFSTTTAWSRSKDFENLLKEAFPSVEIYYRTTDEFGNFRLCNDSQGKAGFEWYTLYTGNGITGFGKDGRDAFMALLRQALEGFQLPEDITDEQLCSDEFLERLDDWRGQKKEREDIYYEIYQLQS